MSAPSLVRRAAGRDAVLDRVTRGAYRAGRVAGRAEVALGRLPVRPWMILCALVAADWLVIAEVGRIALHRGWLYFDGGAGTHDYTAAWVLAHGHVPSSGLGYGYPLLLAPIAAFAGPNLLVGLPAIVFANAIVLAPLALLCLYGVGKAIGGVRFGLTAALLWLVLPLLAIRFFLPDYHDRYVDVTLPPALGLTAGGELASTAAVLAAAYFGYRALCSSALFDGLAAGLAAGLAIGIAPANVLFLAALVAALAVAWRPRQLALVALGLVPSLVALALWRYRASGADPFAVGHDLSVQWSILKGNLDGLRKWGWSKRLLEWVAVAGVVGLARRSIPGAMLVGGWLASYLIVEGGDPAFSVTTGKFLIQMLPAVPALVLLAVSLVYLIPVLGRRALQGGAPSWPRGRRGGRTALGLLGVLAVLPIAVVAALPALGAARAATLGSYDVYTAGAQFPFPLLPEFTTPAPAALGSYDVYVPAGQFALTATIAGGTVRLSWPAQRTGRTPATYIVYRSPADAMTCLPVRHAAAACSYDAAPLAVAPAGATSYDDHPPAGRWSYRVALAATAVGPARDAYPLTLSAPASVTLGV